MPTLFSSNRIPGLSEIVQFTLTLQLADSSRSLAVSLPTVRPSAASQASQFVSVVSLSSTVSPILSTYRLAPTPLFIGPPRVLLRDVIKSLMAA